MEEPLLLADCSRCAALCCVGLAFDQSAFFAFDKAAGAPCPNLTLTHRCSVHDELEPRGFVGCINYDCLGAGQRVTQELFAGRSWRENPEIARSMFDAFRAMRSVHELLSLLRAAGRLPLSPPQEQRRAELQGALCPPDGWSVQKLAAFEQGSVPAEIQAFFTSLRGSVPEAQRPRRLPIAD